MRSAGFRRNSFLILVQSEEYHLLELGDLSTDLKILLDVLSAGSPHGSSQTSISSTSSSRDIVVVVRSGIPWKIGRVSTTNARRAMTPTFV